MSKTVGIAFIVAIISFCSGLLVGSYNTVNQDKYDLMIERYKSEIQEYQDYIEALDKHTELEVINEEPGVKVLRNKLVLTNN